MNIAEFDFELPEHLIAQQPMAQRDQSRLLLVNRASGNWSDCGFAQLPELLREGDLLVINDTRVFPARLNGHRIHQDKTGAAVEALLLRKLSDAPLEWEVVARPGRALREGTAIEFGHGKLRGIIIKILAEGRRIIRFEASENFDQIVDEIGNTPLPPYIRRDPIFQNTRLDEPRYQTIYASQRGAIAAPTAGLHFTPGIFEALSQRGIETVQITHHVGYGTFQPVRVEQIERHHVEAEHYEISEAAAAKINQARREKRRIITVGTTTTRCLESASDQNGILSPGKGRTELFIYPGYRFKMVSGLVTNFHLPKSSLLMLVSAFAGREFIIEAYQYAVAARYRFYSYGDGMLIL
jgi:S-adenosylmethionine:tRNA ribosyltransferase-isomerase